jgi:hypothetical protein
VILIHTPANSTIIWPYSLADLRRDNPNVSFSVSPTADDLAPFNVYEVQPTDAPAADSRTKRVEEARPELVDGIWQQRWVKRDATAEEIITTADWARFKRIALNSDTLNQIIATAYDSVPVAAGALASALLRAESGDVSDFADAWRKITRAVDVPAEVITGFVGVATACQLPADFVAALSPN